MKRAKATRLRNPKCLSLPNNWILDTVDFTAFIEFEISGFERRMQSGQSKGVKTDGRPE